MMEQHLHGANNRRELIAKGNEGISRDDINVLYFDWSGFMDVYIGQSSLNFILKMWSISWYKVYLDKIYVHLFFKGRMLWKKKFRRICQTCRICVFRYLVLSINIFNLLDHRSKCNICNAFSTVHGRCLINCL